ncbi:protein BCAP isoform X2 [Grus americana]|uniref:protein BCAP isoform X2 n=1 Tax=Grus americana TaxID=9117 RepID=UPI002408359D|nr:protein BCAP isoform X2 [Grus americana]XP_054689844.1 protein BCAP isoform X2 [Grus americana]
MLSASLSSSSLPVHNCTAPLLDCDHATELNSKNIDTLMQRLSENETQNTNLRRKILEKEKHVKELSSTLQLEKVNVQKEDHLSRSVKAVQAHLQCQIQRKEVENDELKVKIQTLEKKIAEWKLQVGEYKHQMLALRETSEQKKTALKKAIKSQKQRAEHFEAAVENLTSRIREREVKLSEILSASDVWKNKHDTVVEGKTTLEIQTEDLRKQITSLLAELKRKEEWRRNSDEEILGKLNSVNSENEKIYLENEKLKASLATLENSTVSVENELLHLQEKAKLQENLIEQYKNQVQKLQTAVEELKSRYETVLNENKRITESKCLEVDKVSSARNELSFSQEEDSVNSMGSHSSEEENSKIQKKYEDLKWQLEKLEFRNEELACQLKKEDESLQCSKLQLEEKIAEYNGLTRQLEFALEEGRKMVAEELEKMSHREQALQTKMLILETEVREKQEEKEQLLCIFHRNEKHREVCLKELENSLQKSENKTQSIQNYVQFLKASYVTMFG